MPAENLVGKYRLHISGLGNVAMFMQTTQGLILCVICPIILLVAYDMIRRRHYEKTSQKVDIAARALCPGSMIIFLQYPQY